jgi:hypothetical protein
MRPDDRDPFTLIDEAFVPLDPELEALDGELAAGGAIARTRRDDRPDRAFGAELRARLLAQLSAGAPTFATIAPGGAEGALPGTSWAPAPLRPSTGPRIKPGGGPLAPRRARWSLFAAAAAIVAVSVVAASGAFRLDGLFPGPVVSPTPSPIDTESPSESGPVAPPSPEASLAPIVDPSLGPPDLPSFGPTAVPTPDPTPRATPRPTPKPTATPSPTVGPMNLSLLACPGGVRIDYTKLSGPVDHYTVLRAIGSSVPATWPADGATVVDTASGWDATVTDGFDDTLDGGTKASYRAYAFDTSGDVLAMSPAKSVVGIASGSLGTFTADPVSPGTMTFSWAAPSVDAACFTFGKVVASPDDPDPSYLTGAPYVAVIGSPTDTSVTIGDLPSGQTVFMRYEVIVETAMGRFVAARTGAVQVAYP